MEIEDWPLWRAAPAGQTPPRYPREGELRQSVPHQGKISHYFPWFGALEQVLLPCPPT